MTSFFFSISESSGYKRLQGPNSNTLQSGCCYWVKKTSNINLRSANELQWIPADVMDGEVQSAADLPVALVLLVFVENRQKFLHVPKPVEAVSPVLRLTPRHQLRTGGTCLHAASLAGQRQSGALHQPSWRPQSCSVQRSRSGWRTKTAAGGRGEEKDGRSQTRPGGPGCGSATEPWRRQHGR